MKFYEVLAKELIPRPSIAPFAQVTVVLLSDALAEKEAAEAEKDKTILHYEIDVVPELERKIAEYEEVIRVVKLDSAAVHELVDRQAEEINKTRLVLLLNHGHSGAYLDDGEMQCGDCAPNWDYGRPLLSEITKRVVFALNKDATLRAKVERLKDALHIILDEKEFFGLIHNYAEKALKEVDHD